MQWCFLGEVCVFESLECASGVWADGSLKLDCTWMPGLRVSKQNVPLWWDESSGSGQRMHRYLTNSVSHRWSGDKPVTSASSFNSVIRSWWCQSHVMLDESKPGRFNINVTKVTNTLIIWKEQSRLVACSRHIYSISYLIVTFLQHESYNKRTFWHSAFIQLLKSNFSKIRFTQTNGEAEDEFTRLISRRRIIWKARLEYSCWMYNSYSQRRQPRLTQMAGVAARHQPWEDVLFVLTFHFSSQGWNLIGA